MNQQGQCAPAEVVEDDEFDGICKDQNGKSPPNYSKNGQSKTDCAAACSAERLCVGYSHNTAGRCALWVEQNIGTCPAKSGFQKHPGNGWIMGQSEITKQTNVSAAELAAGWICVPDKSKEPVETVINYTTIGAGMCTMSDNTTSPSNYSKDYNSAQDSADFCREECDRTNRCIGFSILTHKVTAALMRCALWVDQAGGSKGGWQYNAGEAGWNYGVSTIEGSDKATTAAGVWNCYQRNSTVQIGQTVVDYKFTSKGTGVCTNNENQGSANLSKNGVEMSDCEAYCKQYANCKAIGYMMTGEDGNMLKRCALYIDEQHSAIDNTSLPTKHGQHVAGFHSNAGTAPVGNWEVTQSSGAQHAPLWRCYSKDAMVN
eukprot:UN02049